MRRDALAHCANAEFSKPRVIRGGEPVVLRDVAHRYDIVGATDQIGAVESAHPERCKRRIVAFQPVVRNEQRSIGDAARKCRKACSHDWYPRSLDTTRLLLPQAPCRRRVGENALISNAKRPGAKAAAGRNYREDGK